MKKKLLFMHIILKYGGKYKTFGECFEKGNKKKKKLINRRMDYSMYLYINHNLLILKQLQTQA